MPDKIFADRAIADQIAGVLTKAQGKPWIVEKALTGFAVTNPSEQAAKPALTGKAAIADKVYQSHDTKTVVMVSTFDNVDVDPLIDSLKVSPAVKQAMKTFNYKLTAATSGLIQEGTALGIPHHLVDKAFAAACEAIGSELMGLKGAATKALWVIGKGGVQFPKATQVQMQEFVDKLADQADKAVKAEIKKLITPTLHEVDVAQVEKAVVSGSMKYGKPAFQQVPKGKGPLDTGVTVAQGFVEVMKSATPVVQKFSDVLKKQEQVCHFVWPYIGQSPQFLHIMVDGKATWVAKNKLINHDIHFDTKMVDMVVPLAFAKKRGWIKATGKAS